jgi:hypothetical protein
MTYTIVIIFLLHVSVSLVLHFVQRRELADVTAYELGPL